jgi:hypothetical protein
VKSRGKQVETLVQATVENSRHEDVTAEQREIFQLFVTGSDVFRQVSFQQMFYYLQVKERSLPQ